MLYGGRVPALEHINLTVEKGDWLAVMGPSGSGKTTLMNIIGCLDRPTSGQYYLDGEDILNYRSGVIKSAWCFSSSI